MSCSILVCSSMSCSVAYSGAGQRMGGSGGLNTTLVPTTGPELQPVVQTAALNIRTV